MAKSIDDSPNDPTASAAHEIAPATVQLRAQHKREATALQRTIDSATALVGQPNFVAALAAMISLWIVGNLTASTLGYRPIDPSPFAWLQGASTIGALLVTTLILTTQRREDQLADHRAQLILELAILNDQKTSKIIELLEEARRDNPAIVDRVDPEASAMSSPSDTHAVLDAIKVVHEDIK